MFVKHSVKRCTRTCSSILNCCGKKGKLYYTVCKYQTLTILAGFYIIVTNKCYQGWIKFVNNRMTLHLSFLSLVCFVSLVLFFLHLKYNLYWSSKSVQNRKLHYGCFIPYSDADVNNLVNFYSTEFVSKTF